MRPVGLIAGRTIPSSSVSGAPAGSVGAILRVNITSGATVRVRSDDVANEPRVMSQTQNYELGSVPNLSPLLAGRSSASTSATPRTRCSGAGSSAPCASAACRGAAGHLRPARRPGRCAGPQLQGVAHQRCRVHFARNLLALVPKSHRTWSPRCSGPSSPNPTPKPSPGLGPGPRPARRPLPQDRATDGRRQNRGPRLHRVPPQRTGPRSGRPTRSSGSTRRSNAAPASSASSPTRPPSSASSEPSSTTPTTNGKSPTAAMPVVPEQANPRSVGSRSRRRCGSRQDCVWSSIGRTPRGARSK